MEGVQGVPGLRLDGVFETDGDFMKDPIDPRSVSLSVSITFSKGRPNDQ